MFISDLDNLFTKFVVKVIIKVIYDWLLNNR